MCTILNPDILFNIGEAFFMSLVFKNISDVCIVFYPMDIL